MSFTAIWYNTKLVYPNYHCVISQDALKRLFSDARTTQIESDKSKWLASHGFYQKAVDVVKQLVANDDIVYVMGWHG